MVVAAPVVEVVPTAPSSDPALFESPEQAEATNATTTAVATRIAFNSNECGCHRVL